MDSLLSSVRDFFKEHPNPRLSSWAGFSRPLFDKLRAGSAELNSAIGGFQRPDGPFLKNAREALGESNSAIEGSHVLKAGFRWVFFGSCQSLVNRMVGLLTR